MTCEVVKTLGDGIGGKTIIKPVEQSEFCVLEQTGKTHVVQVAELVDAPAQGISKSVKTL